MFTKITLRATLESDLQTFFEYQLDPIANRMAAFTAKDPTDRDAWMVLREGCASVMLES